MTRLALAGMAGWLAACGASAAPPPAPKTAVSIENYHFVPATLKIAAGSSVTWTNKDDDAHTVMDAAGAFRSGALDGGQSYSYTFAKAGVYRIACSMHPQMSETIIVE
ncbi:MAG TPA: cupredoxin domain-containing protein [Steroidobacteraceae bacterium]|jgi:plastocyanin|nr:cupredoxin domain-containing protein [Steroidobacteraceae bacterium]